MQNKHLIALIVLVACSAMLVSCEKVSSRKDLEKIESLENKVDQEREKLLAGEADTSLIGELGRTYLAFADNYPQSPETPEFLFRAGELYSNDLGNITKAISIFKRNYQSYPQHETASNALFLIAYLNHNVLQNLVQAEKYYKEFLDAYPGHKMFQTAEFELKNLGKSPEEVFNEFIRPEEGTDSTTILP